MDTITKSSIRATTGAATTTVSQKTELEYSRCAMPTMESSVLCSMMMCERPYRAGNHATMVAKISTIFSHVKNWVRSATCTAMQHGEVQLFGFTNDVQSAGKYMDS